MLIGLIVLDMALAAWSLRLMQAASDRQEFSLFLAGILVAAAGAALIGVYGLTNSYMCFLNGIAQRGY
jgi:fucose permease